MAPKKKEEEGQASNRFWFPEADEGYVLGDILHEDEQKNLQVRLHLANGTTKTLITQASTAKPVNPKLLDGVNDNTQLMHLHEPSLLYNLRCRYKENKIYTYTGYILIAVNPYKALSCYGEAEMKSYKGKSIGVLPPHLYAMADRAFRSMKVDGSCQSIVISGESGSGKTESSKIVMKYLAICGQPLQKKGGDAEERDASSTLHALSEKVLACNPILEAFGNAKTVMNHNSSRFGKFTRIHFDRRNWLVGADIVTYLLEKTRTVTQSSEERNYHSFYQLFASSSASQKQELRLGAPHDFAYLKNGMVDVAAIDDSANAKEVAVSMGAIGILPEQQQGIRRLLAMILHLGNVDFVDTDDDSCKVVESTPLQSAAHFMQTPVESFEEALVSRTMRSMSNSVYKIPLKVQEARYSRDTLAKAVYSRLFDWLCKQINISLLTNTETRAFIGVLDIFGFEQFQVNSFEQLCINFANEKLQAHFNTQVFRQEQEIYLREAIRWDPIAEPNNQECIEMLSAKSAPVGVFALLDEQCRLPKCTDKTFTEKVFQTHKGAISSGLLAEPPKGSGLLKNEGFVVRHYAGLVTYTSDGFRQKNNNSLHEDLELVLKTAEDPFVINLMTDTEQSSAAAGGRRGGGKSQARFSSVSGHFAGQLASLTDTLQETTSHFVRCINPNKTKTPDCFVGGHVLHQLRCSGMMEALRLMHEGFPTRCPYEDLYDRYKDMMPRSVAQLDSPSFCEILLMALGLEKADYQLGITKVFFRAGKLAFLDSLTGSEYKELAPDIVNKVRVWLVKKRWRRHTIATVAFLRLKRTLEDLRLLRKVVSAAFFMTLMANRSKLSVKRARQIRQRNAASKLQKNGRRMIMVAKYFKTQWAVRLAQRVLRGHAARRTHGAALADLRAKRRAREEAERKAREEAKKQAEREEMERIREMARSGGGTVSKATASKYSSKGPQKAVASTQPNRNAEGGGALVVSSEDFEARLSKMEKDLSELQGLKKLVEAQAEEIRELKKQLERGRTDSSEKPSRPRASTTAGSSSQVPPAPLRRRPSNVSNQSGKGHWGLLDMLGIGSQLSNSTAPTSGATLHQAAAPNVPSSRRTSVAAPPPNKVPNNGDAMMSLAAAIAEVQKHFEQANVPGTAKTLELLGNDQCNKDVAVLVRGQLCTALSRVLLHGFKSFKIIGRFHIWDFVSEACASTHLRVKNQGGKYTKAELTLTTAVVDINENEGMANNPNIKFRSFVCAGLNNQQMPEWMEVLTTDKDVVAKFYESWAYIQSNTDALPKIKAAVRPLCDYPFKLSIDYEISRWDLH